MKPWLQHTQKIIAQYTHQEPLPAFLKKYFKQFPILGSRDRRFITQMVFAFMRAAKGFATMDDFSRQVLYCLCMTHADETLIAKCFPEIYSLQPIQEEAKKLFNHQQLIHPLPELSEGLDEAMYLNNLLRTPKVFIRMMQPSNVVLQKLLKAEVAYLQLNDEVLAFESGVKLDQVLSDEDYVVQDYASQQIIDPVKPLNVKDIWDCCAGAGGKSILLRQHFKNAQIFCTDVRASILHNLQNRFALYHLKQPNKQVLDLQNESQIKSTLGRQQFDLIIADVPCSGSGTWARSPEEAFYFQEESLSLFTQRQQQIVANIFPFVKPQGYLLYATCSAFKAENENQLSYFESQGWKVLEQKVINGMGQGADIMYHALLQKS